MAGGGGVREMNSQTGFRFENGYLYTMWVYLLTEYVPTLGMHVAIGLKAEDMNMAVNVELMLFREMFFCPSFC